jgi:serine/threonine-protein kinase
MGVVYLADDPLLNRQVAIKTVDLAVEDEQERNFLRDRLLKDARAAAALTHTGIVSVYDVLQEGGTAFLVMEYIHGESLAAVLKRTPRPEIVFTVRVLREMAAALDYTHARGIVHRDIKPANVMIDAMSAAKIMDFGIARIADARTSTPTGMVMGTVQYMAPEQVKGEAVDGKADQFALAAVAYEMLTGTTIFGQHSLTTLAYKIVNEAPEPVRARNSSVPPAVDAVVARALSKSPQDRFPSCGLFAAALERAFAGESPQAEAPTATLAIPQKTASRMPLIAGIAAAAVLGGGALLWHPWGQPRTPQPPPTVAVAPPVAASPVPVVEQAIAPPTPANPPKPVKPAEDQPEPMNDPGPPPSHPALDALEQARKFNQAGQTDAALQAVNRAISVNPRYGPALAFRGELHQKQKQWELAAADYAEALRFVPRHGFTHLQRGLCLVQLHQDDQAFDEFTKAIEFRGDLMAGYNQRGLIYARRKDYPKAIADFTQAIHLAPDAPMAYQFRANARRNSGDAAGAREDMRRFHELKPVE